jgi:hypothetical protein
MGNSLNMKPVPAAPTEYRTYTLFSKQCAELDREKSNRLPDSDGLLEKNQAAGTLYKPVLNPLCNVGRTHGSTHSTE